MRCRGCGQKKVPPSGGTLYRTEPGRALLFRLFDEPDSAEMYSKIELSCHDWETGMDEILETMTF